MTTHFGQRPFGLNDISLLDAAGANPIDLPDAVTMKITERTVNGELAGDDAIVAVAAIPVAWDVELSAGGIPLAAFGRMTGRTVTTTGVTPNQVREVVGVGRGEYYPYFAAFGRAFGEEGTDDLHLLIFRMKLTGNIEGGLANGEFYMTGARGVAVQHPTNSELYRIIQNETAVALPVAFP